MTWWRWLILAIPTVLVIYGLCLELQWTDEDLRVTRGGCECGCDNDI